MGLLPSIGVRPMPIATLEEYLREFSVEIGDRILTSYPALHAPGDPVSPILKNLLRKPFAAQEVAIAGAVKRLQESNSVAIIAEMGTGKTLMAIAVAHVFSAGRPYACIFVVPPQILLKTSREIIQTIPGAIGGLLAIDPVGDHHVEPALEQPLDHGGGARRVVGGVAVHPHVEFGLPVGGK